MKKEYESYTVFEFNSEYNSFNVGDKIYTKVTVSPRLYDGNITYTSSDESVATIDENVSVEDNLFIVFSLLIKEK